MSPAVSSAVHPPPWSSAGGSALVGVSVLVMGLSYAAGEFPAIIPDVAENEAGITLNDDAVSLREWIAKHSDHLDAGIHELRQILTEQHDLIVTLVKQVGEMHEELEAARPLIEKWQHSRIRKLAQGQMPWGQP